MKLHDPALFVAAGVVPELARALALQADRAAVVKRFRAYDRHLPKLLDERPPPDPRPPLPPGAIRWDEGDTVWDPPPPDPIEMIKLAITPPVWRKSYSEQLRETEQYVRRFLTKMGKL